MFFMNKINLQKKNTNFENEYKKFIFLPESKTREEFPQTSLLFFTFSTFNSLACKKPEVLSTRTVVVSHVCRDGRSK